MLDAHSLLGAIARQRPIFHSEADFQHSFAWYLHLHFPEARIRLERPIQSTLGLLHIDVIAGLDSRLHAFELKYKTRAIDTRIGSELYALQDHGAQPIGRYDFLKDVARLEAVAQNPQASVAYAILLTNDSAYWAEARGVDDTSAAFSLHDGRVLSGRLDWSPRASVGTKRGREEAITLRGRYTFLWQAYSEIDCKRYSRFRYLAVEIPPGLGA